MKIIAITYLLAVMVNLDIKIVITLPNNRIDLKTRFNRFALQLQCTITFEVFKAHTRQNTKTIIFTTIFATLYFEIAIK